MHAGLSLLALSGSIPQRQVRTCLPISGAVSLIAVLISKKPLSWSGWSSYRMNENLDLQTKIKPMVLSYSRL